MCVSLVTASLTLVSCGGDDSSGGDAVAGKQLFAANGCGGCHTFKAASSNAPIGPDLGSSLKGKDRDYVMRAIVLPNADVATNFTPGGMPEDFAERIAPDDLNELVDFIVAGVASGG